MVFSIVLRTSGLLGLLQHFVAFAPLEYGLQWSIVDSPM